MGEKIIMNEEKFWEFIENVFEKYESELRNTDGGYSELEKIVEKILVKEGIDKSELEGVTRVIHNAL